MSNSATALFCLNMGNPRYFMWKTSAFQAFKGTAKLALPLRQGLKCGIFCFPRAKPPEFQKDGFLIVRFPVSSTAFLD